MAEKWKTPYYFPSKDADVVPWTQNFVLVLSEHADSWGIAESLVSALGGLFTAFRTAYNKRKQPDSGKVSVR